MVLLKRAGFHA